MNFESLRALIDGKRHLELVAALRDMDPSQRKELVAPLKEYERVERADWGNYERWTGFALAGAGLLPNASSLAPWLVRNQMLGSDELVLEVLRHRDVPWLPDLGARLAARMPMRDPRHDLFTLVVSLCPSPPDTDGFLNHLAWKGPAAFRPGYEVLIPRLLEVVGVGAALHNEAWPPFLLTKADRSVLLDGCLARLQQGGTHTEMTGFLVLHEVIHPTAADVAAHAKDYVALLPDSRLAVASVAQAQLQRVDSLDFALLCDASRWIFGRTDKKLVRTQLAWLGSFASERPDEVSLVAASLFPHPSADLRGRAVSLVRKHFDSLSAAARTEILALAAALPADQAGELGVAAAADAVAALAPYAPETLPAPVASPDLLAREILPLFGRNSASLAAVEVERVLEALVRFAWQDRAALRTALKPVFAKHEWLLSVSSGHTRSPYGEFCSVICASVARPTPLEAVEQWQDQVGETRLGSPREQWIRRLREIAVGLEHSPRPALVSTPTEASGLIDPDVLAARLAVADAEGWLPWPRDLWQALRRLPRDARTVPSDGEAGRVLRDWLAAGGHHDPEVTIVESSYTPRSYFGYQSVTEHRLLAAVEPGLPEPQRFWRGYRDWGELLECWPAALPAQREVVAAHLVPELTGHVADGRGSDGPLLPLLARADGPIGPAMNLALAYGLGAQRTTNKANTVDALLILAQRDQLDGTSLGDTVGLLLERGDLVLGRAVTALRDVAGAGAARQVWDLVAAALPRLWSHNRVADLLELAVEVAQVVRPGGEVRGLADVAGRKGSSRAVKEAKRLVAALNGC